VATLFGRRWELIVDNLELTNLDFRFHVAKSTKAEPNKLDIQVVNMSPDHVAQVTKRATSKGSTGVNIRLSAGLGEDLHLIFDGDAREISTAQTSAERITTIAAHDGGRAFRESRISQSFAPGASITSAIVACARAMGIGIGNANEASAGASINGLGAAFPNGITLAGRASDQLSRVTRAAGLTWSIQNSVLQLQKNGQPLQTTSVRIASDAGMVGSPSVDMDANVASSDAKKKTKPTLVKVRTLIIPGIYPGRKVVLDTADYQGGYQVVEALFTGATDGNDWYIDAKLRPY
jgi:hypothetical protein